MRFFVPLASVLALAPASLADVTLSYAGGVLGADLYYNVASDPFEIFGVAPSLTTGPTPLSIFDPSDPRVLDVGLDLLVFWSIGVLDADGLGTFQYPLPADAALAGLVLHAQAISAPGATTLVDELSNSVQLELALEGTSIPTLGTPLFPRRLHSGTLLAGSGSILLAGGAVPSSFGGGNPVIRSDAEIYEAQTGTFHGPIPMPGPRALHTATPLQDGRVLLLGGVTNGSNVLASGVLYDPASAAFTPVPPMAGPRVLHSATRLADGRVLVVGGSATYDASHPIGFGQPGSLSVPALKLSQLYDPGTNSWSSGPLLGAGLTAHQAVLLDDGRVLIMGGFAFPTGAPPHTALKAFLYDPAANQFLPAGDLTAPVCFHSAVKTMEGNVLVAGGGSVNLATSTFTPIDRSFLYDAAAGVFVNKAALPAAGGITTPSGDTICICRAPRIPISPPPGSDTGSRSSGSCLPGPVVYAYGVGSVLTDLATGAGLPGDAIFTTDGQVSSWVQEGAYSVDRFQPTFVAEGDGSRLLISGGETVAAGPSAELWIVSY